MEPASLDGTQDTAALIGAQIDRKPPLIHRIVFLCLAVCIPLSSQAVYDAPVAMGKAFLENYGMDSEKLGTLYSVYGLPSLFLVFVTGLFVDRVGPNKSGVLFNAFMLLGTVIVMFSGRSFAMLVVGFAVFGIGGSSILVAQQTTLTRYFKGSELAFSFGMTTTVLRAFSVLDFNVLPNIASKHGVATGYILGAAASLLGFVATLVVWWITATLSRKRFRDATSALDSSAGGAGAGVAKRCGWLSSVVNLDHLRRLPKMYWLLVFYSVSICTAELCFELFSTTLYGEAGLADEDAARATSTASIAVIIFSPLTALVADRFGRYVHIMIFGSAVGVAATVACLMLPLHGLIPHSISFVFGAAYAICVGVSWPATGLLVAEDAVGTGFGVLSGCFNVGLFIFPYVLGALRKWTGGYTASLIVVLALCGCALGTAGVLFILDSRGDGKLRRPIKPAVQVNGADLNQ